MDSIDQRLLNLTVPDISLQDVMAAIGMPSDPAQANPALVSVVEETMREALDQYIRPKSLIRAVNVAPMDGESVLVCGTERVFCPFELFDGADGAVLLLSTLGEGCDNAVSRMLDEGDSLGAMVVDSVGSIAISKIMILTRHIIEDELTERGLKFGPELQPGCCTIGMEVQGTVCSLLDTDAIGLSINESLIMTPKKSISSVVPYGKELVHPYDGRKACIFCKQHGKCPSEW